MKSPGTIIAIYLLGIILASCKNGKEAEEVKGLFAGISIDEALTQTECKADDATDLSNESESSDEDDDEDLNDVLAQCGVPDFSDEELIRFSQEITYDFVRTVEAGYFDIFVDMSATITLSNNKAGLSFLVSVDPQNVTIDEKGGAPIVDTQPAMDQALDEAKQFAGDVINQSIPQNSNFTKEWKGIVCTIPGAKSLVTTRDGYETEVEFTPGYPPAISPIADPIRYEKELGQIRHFPDIEAKVIRTNNPRLTVGQIIKGSVIVEKIPNEKTSPDGRSHVKSDVAYRVTNYFGTREQTLDIGFHLWNEYYIDHATGSFNAVFADVGGPNLQYFVKKAEGEEQ